MLRCCSYQSPLGSLLLAAEGESLVGLWMEGQRFFGVPYGAALPSAGRVQGVLANACAWLDAYFGGARPSPTALPLTPPGTVFQRRVWQELLGIPYGSTCTYGELAQRLSSSPRAVGRAVGRNPLSIVVPCHRVVGADGGLGGYAGGLSRKQYLLSHECGTSNSDFALVFVLSRKHLQW